MGNFQKLRCRLGAWRSRALAYLLPLVPRSVWRLLPGSSESFGPPRHSQPWAVYARRHRIEWARAYPSQTGDLSVPFYPPKPEQAYRERGSRYHWPEQGVARLRDARVISAHGWCVGAGDTFLSDFSFNGDRRSCLIYHLTTHNAPRRLDGVTLNLCSAHAAFNFCHWLMDAVARVALLEQTGVSLTSVDHVLLPYFPGKTAEWVLGRLAFPPAKVIHPGMKDQFRCEILLQPSYPGAVAAYAPWPIEFYRRLFPAPRVSRKRRVYIPRRGRRGLSNADAVEAELRRCGFEPLVPEGHRDLHHALADVSHVVGVHGAALANLVFGRPATRVLELMPSDLRTRYYWSICSGARMPYGVVVGKSERERRIRGVDSPTNAAFAVNLRELEAGLGALLSVPTVE